MGPGCFGITPPHYLTPYSMGKTPYKLPVDDTPSEVVEVCDEAFEEIMLSSDLTHQDTLQGAVDGLTRPRDEQLVKANALLVKKGKSTEERLNGLAKFEDNRHASKKD